MLTNRITDGVDAKQYDPKDLYSHISCQFQQTYPVNFTLREWLHTGDVTVANDEERMQECLKITGADKIIAKFPKGLDARLGPYPADDTPQSLLREFIQETKTGGFDPWEANYDIKLEQDIERDDDYDDDTVIGLGQQKKKDCAFSPGEWSKLVIARALMRKSADLRYVGTTLLSFISSSWSSRAKDRICPPEYSMSRPPNSTLSLQELSLTKSNPSVVNVLLSTLLTIYLHVSKPIKSSSSKIALTWNPVRMKIFYPGLTQSIVNFIPLLLVAVAMAVTVTTRKKRRLRPMLKRMGLMY